MTQGFDELNKDDLGYNGFKDFEAGAKSRQAEIDGLQKRIDILLGEVYLMTDAIGYHRVLNILKGTNQ